MEASVRMIPLNGGTGKSMKAWKLRDLKDTPRLAKAKEVPDGVKLAMAAGHFTEKDPLPGNLQKREVIAAALAPVIKAYEAEDINTDIEDDHDALVASLTEAAPTSYTNNAGKPAFLWPVEGDHLRISSPFGYRTHPITGKRAFHAGIDIPAPQGTAVLAAADGEVTGIGEHPRLGRYVKVSHADGTYSLYGHLQKAEASMGAVVKAGERIGRVGSTGRSTGPHLDFSIRQAGKPFDPMRVLNDILEQKKLAFNR
jgi:murein DD-endopeptidase MepM/ murein hydrolase activator NlpD